MGTYARTHAEEGSKVLQSRSRLFWLVGLVAIIVAFGIFIQFYKFTEFPPALYPDEAFYGTDALRSAATGQYRVFYPNNHGHEGLIIALHVPFIHAFGTAPWVLRIQTALVGCLSLIAIWLFAREFAGNFASSPGERAIPYRRQNAIALFSLLFLATSSWELHLSRLGFRAIYVPFFAALAVWALLRGRRLSSKFWYGLSGLFTGIVLYTYPNSRFVPFVMLGIFLCDFLRTRRRWQQRWPGPPTGFDTGGFATFLFVSGLVFAPLAFYYVTHLNEFFDRYDMVGFTSAASPLRELLRSLYRTAQSPFFFGDGNWRHNISDAAMLHPLVALSLFIGLLFCAVSLMRSLRGSDVAKPAVQPLGAVILLLFAVIMSLPAVLTTEGIPHTLRSGGMIPPLVVMAAIGAERVLAGAYGITPRMLPVWGINAVLAVTGAMLMQSVFFDYFYIWGPNPKTSYAYMADLTALAYEIDRAPAGVPKYVVTDEPDTAPDLEWLVQPIVFITNTASPEAQARRNIHYVGITDLRQHGIPSVHGIYWLIDKAVASKDWLRKTAPEADIRVLGKSWQEMVDLAK